VHRIRRSCPTRRASDLVGESEGEVLVGGEACSSATAEAGAMTRERPRASTKATSVAEIFLSTVMSLQGGPARMAAHGRAPPSRRSEEHTSELQSRENLV